jgi:hypothetical protein
MRPGDYSLPDGYSVEILAESEAVSADDVLAFWERERILPEEEARRRIEEVTYVGVHRDAGVVGVSTAFLRVQPQLGVVMWHQRGFVTAAHRESNLGMFFAIWGISLLEDRFTSGRDTRGLGVVQEIENEGLKRYFNRGWEPPTDMVFIGENVNGAHVRVHPFPGARIPPEQAPA